MESQEPNKIEPIALSCGIEIPQQSELGADLTVGRIFLLKCDSSEKDLDFAKVTLLPTRAEDQYKIKYLNGQETAAGFDLQVTSYRPGDHKLENVMLISKDKVFQISNLQFAVKSVQDPQKPQAEPFGPFGPFELTVPMLYWSILAGIILLVLAIFGFRLRMFLKRKKFLEELARRESSLSPLAELSQSVRKMQRQYKALNHGETNSQEIELVLKELEAAYRLYLSRMFRVPTDNLPLKEVLKLAKKFNPIVVGEVQEDLRALNREIEHMHKDLSKLQSKDCIQLMQQIRKLADHINRHKNAEAKK